MATDQKTIDWQFQLCKGCGYRKPLTSDYFRRSSKSASGFRAKCKLCNKVDEAENQKRKKEARKHAHREVRTPVVPITPEPKSSLNVEQEAKKLALLELVDRHRSEFEGLTELMECRIATEMKAVG